MSNFSLLDWHGTGAELTSFPVTHTLTKCCTSILAHEGRPWVVRHSLPRADGFWVVGVHGPGFFVKPIISDTDKQPNVNLGIVFTHVQNETTGDWTAAEEDE